MSGVVHNTTDLSDKFGAGARVLPDRYRSLGARRAFAGEAVTIYCFEDSSRIKELIATPGRGKVMVIDAGGSSRCAVWGDQTAAQAAANGWEGVIIHGYARDCARLAKIDMGMLALGLVPRKSERRGQGVIGLVVDLGGISCAPGDWVVVDEDGGLVVPGSDWDGQED